MILHSRELMPIVLAALERGQNVRLTVHGGSMTPFIQDGDVVELEPFSAAPHIADIVLARTSEGYYCIHRIVRLEGEHFWLRGDAQEWISGPFPRQEIFAKALAVSRDGRVRVFNRGLWRLLGRLWPAVHPLGRRLWPLIDFTRRGWGWLIRRLFRSACKRI